MSITSSSRSFFLVLRQYNTRSSVQRMLLRPRFKNGFQSRFSTTFQLFLLPLTFGEISELLEALGLGIDRSLRMTMISGINLMQTRLNLKRPLNYSRMTSSLG